MSTHLIRGGSSFSRKHLNNIERRCYMKKPSKAFITAITMTSLILLSIFCIFLLKIEHDWREKEKIRVQFLEEVTPQLEEFHKKKVPLLNQLETEAKWVDDELLLIYRIEVPDNQIDMVNNLMDSKYCKKYPELKDAIISFICYDLEYISASIKKNIETDIEYTATTQLITPKGKVIMWASDSEIIECIASYQDENNLGDIDFVGSPLDAVGAPEIQYTPLIEH